MDQQRVVRSPGGATGSQGLAGGHRRQAEEGVEPAGRGTVNPKKETTPMKKARVGQAARATWFPLAAGLAALALAVLPLASRAGKPADERPDYWIGYTMSRTDAPGTYPNQDTARAFVVRADGSGATELAPELASKPHQRTSFAGWSPDGRQAIIHQSWESPENGAWEDKHGAWRFSAEHWLLDIILLDMETKKTTNLTAVERVSFYNAGLKFWPEKQFSFSAMIDGQLRPFRMDRDGKNKKPVSAGPGFIYGASPSPDGKRIAYHRDYRLYLADADGRNAQPVKDDHPFHFIEIWSPTGEWLEYLSGEHYNCHPHLIRPDGTGLRKLADRGGYRGVIQPIDKGGDGHSERSDTPTWSRDGKWLYYTAKVGEAVELMRASPGGKIEQLTRSKAGVIN